MADYKVRGLRTIVLNVRDVAASAHFYADLLGLPRDLEAGGLLWLRLGEGARATPLLLHPWDQPEPTRYGISIELEVVNIDAAVAAIQAAGYPVIRPPETMDYGVREVVVSDPDGYVVWLAQPLQ